MTVESGQSDLTTFDQLYAVFEGPSEGWRPGRHADAVVGLVAGLREGLALAWRHPAYAERLQAALDREFEERQGFPLEYALVDALPVLVPVEGANG